MYFVTGGAFNGKRNWVEREFIKKATSSYQWINFYDDDVVSRLPSSQVTLVVIEGLEMGIKHWIKRGNQTEQMTEEFLQTWLDWEKQQKEHTLVLIGTDMSKGIVPVDKEERSWRDITGRCYQKLAQVSEQSIIIWNGWPQTIKRGDLTI